MCFFFFLKFVLQWSVFFALVFWFFGCCIGPRMFIFCMNEQTETEVGTEKWYNNCKCVYV